MTGLFVTGTDTEVGKSVISAALAAGLADRGHAVRALKPLATGGPPPGEDAQLLGLAAGHPPLVHTCFPDPASPERAAREAGRDLDAATLLPWIQGHAAAHAVVVEGVGGWEVPLAPDMRISDLAEELGLPVLIVAANRLGVLNHTLLTVAAVQARGLEVVGVVLNDAFGSHPDLSRWNRDDLRRHLAVPVFSFPRIRVPEDLARAGAGLVRSLRLTETLGMVEPPLAPLAR